MTAIIDKITIMKNKIKFKNNNNKLIEIIPVFKNHISQMKIIDKNITSYAKKINAIIEKEREKSNHTIALKKIQKIYQDIYKNTIGLSSISRVLIHHLNFQFTRLNQEILN